MSDTQPRRFIMSAGIDYATIILSPIIGVVLACLLFWLLDDWSHPAGARMSTTAYCFGIFSLSHLFLVFFRSHGNSAVFWRHPWRFTVVPVLVGLAIWSNYEVAVLAIMLIIWWDVYHSSLQTFGFGRIYDALLGNDPQQGRRWDWWLNLFIYAGPVLIGVNLDVHLQLALAKSALLGEYGYDQSSGLLNWLDSWATVIVQWQWLILWSVGIGFALFLVAYIAAMLRLRRAGYRHSRQKFILYLVTAVTSLVVWGGLSREMGLIDAFWIMNFFHALQYYAIVLKSDGRSIASCFGLTANRSLVVVACICAVVICLAYGIAGQFLVSTRSFFAIAAVVSLMHFWYDGFIWSVRSREVG